MSCRKAQRRHAEGDRGPRHKSWGQTSKMDLGGPLGKRRTREMGKSGCGPTEQEILTFAAMVGPGLPPCLALFCTKGVYRVRSLVAS